MRLHWRQYGHMLAFLLIALASLAQAQDLECGTLPLDEAESMALPWYDNNQMLYDYLEQQGYYDTGGSIGIITPLKQNGGCQSSDCEPTPYLVPLNLWVYRDANGNGDTNAADAQNWLEEVNAVFETAETGIQFYAQSVNVENRQAYYDQIDSQLDITAMFADKGFSNSDAFNIHFVRQTGGNIRAGGQAVLPRGLAVPFTRYSAYVLTHFLDTNTPRTDEGVIKTFAHELGHTLGLLHTHNPGRFFSQIFNDSNGSISNGCYQESVSRTRKNRFVNGCFSTNGDLKCEINGDFLCDTDADPNSSGRVSALPDCDYAHPGGGDFRNDNWGNLWNPPTNNIMAYTDPTCRNEFSEGQIAIMWMTLENWFQSRNQADILGPSQLPCFPGSITLNAPAMDNVISYNWSVTSFNMQIMGGSRGNQVRVQALNQFSNNFGCVTLDMITPYGRFCFTKEIFPSKPAPVSISTNSPSPYEICANSSVQFRANMASHNGNNNYHWTVSNGFVTYGQGTAFATIRTGQPDQWITVNVAVSNGCGTTSGVASFRTRSMVNGFHCQGTIELKTDFEPDGKDE